MSRLTTARKVLTALLWASAADRFRGGFSACSWQQGRQLCGRPPCPGREASQAWDVFEMREKLKMCCLRWQGPCGEWTGNTVTDSLAQLSESHWLLRCRVGVSSSQVGLEGKPAFRRQNHQSFLKKMTLTLKQAEQRTSCSGWSSEENGRNEQF